VFSFFKHDLHNLISDKKISEIFTGSAWALGARMGSTIIAMFTSIIVARFYGAEIMGIVAMINSFMSLAVVFAVLGTDTSILRLIPEHVARYSVTSAFLIYRKIQYFVAGVAVLLGSLLFLGSNLIAKNVFSKPHLSFFIALSSVFLIFLSIAVLNTQAIRGLRLIRTFAFMQMLPAVSKLIILILITLFFFNPYNPIYAIFASCAITAIAGALIMQIVFKKKILPFDVVFNMPVKGILAISFPMFMTATINLAIGQTGILILGIFRTEAEVGYYDIAVKLAMLTTFALGAVNTMVAPKFSELFHSGNMNDLFYVAQKSAKLIFWTTVPILAVLFVLGKPILSLLFGPEFKVAYGAMMLLVIGQFVNSVAGSCGYFMEMTGNQNTYLNIVLGAAIICVGLNFALIPSFGTIGAAIAGMASIIFWNIVTLIFIKMKYGSIIGYFPLFKIR
jgi:O-antigen/teichoic acid export membrane protein